MILPAFVKDVCKYTSKNAPSVPLPEIVIPSADYLKSLSRVFSLYRSFLPESFRGGCSFGNYC